LSNYGDNSGACAFDGADLAEVFERFESLSEAVDAAKGDLKDFLAAAKDAGFDKDALKFALKEKHLDEEQRAVRQIREATRARYLSDLGIETTPLWESAKLRAAVDTISRHGSDVTIDSPGIDPIKIKGRGKRVTERA